MTKTLQVCFGVSAMGSLIEADYAPIIAFALRFDGPLHDFKTYEDFEKAFQDFLDVLCNGLDEFSVVPLFSYRQGPTPSTPLSSTEFIRIVNESEEVIVWVSLGFHENLLLAFMIRLFTLYSLPLEKIKVRKVETQLINDKTEKMLSIGAIPPHQMKAAAPPTTLNQTEIDVLMRGWEAITSSKPETIEAYLKLPSTTCFQEGLKDFRNRMPSSKTGINRLQTELLEAYPLDQPCVNVYYLIGRALGKVHMDVLCDLYVQWHLMQMTNLRAPQPAFLITDPYTREHQVAVPYTREHQVAITDFGRALLDGKANWEDFNPVDYYVGGLHIHSMPPSAH